MCFPSNKGDPKTPKPKLRPNEAILHSVTLTENYLEYCIN